MKLKLEKFIFVSLLITLILLFSLLPNTSIAVFTADDCPYPLKFVAVSENQSGNHYLAIDDSGNIWAWGNNSYGQLGDGSTNSSSVPIQITSGTIFKSVSASSMHSLALDSSGKLWSWGRNVTGQLGTGNTTDVSIPTKVLSGQTFKFIAADATASFAIDTSGNLFGWGNNDPGILSDAVPDGGAYNLTPVQIKSGTKFVKVSVGSHVMALDESNRLWSWGANNNYGELGNGNSGLNTYSYTPTLVNTSTTFSDICVGSNFNLALDTNGNLWGWGRNDYGQLGNNTTNNSSLPVQIKYGTKFSSICANSTTAYAIDTSNTIWSWGYGSCGALGNETTSNSLVPVKVSTTKTFTKIMAKTLGCFAFDTNGDLWGWGYNGRTINGVSYGELGIGTIADKLTPVQITGTYYTVSFISDGITKKTQNVLYGNSATAPTLTKAGYTLSWDKSFTNITSALTVNAIWTANINTAYKVEHYKQNTALNGYSLEETENLTGTTDTTKNAIAKSYPGFTENTTYSGRKASGTISGDGSLVLKLYYDRNTYTVTLNTNSGTINSGNITSYTYGIAQTLPINVTKTGYTFGGWYDNSNCTGSSISYITSTDTGNKTYYAKWTANANTAYKVVHQKMNLDGTTYTTEETENLTGTTGAGVTPAVKTYTGFTSPSTQTTTIAADGTTIVTYKYTRNKYTFTLGTCNGVTTTGSSVSGDYYFEAPITLKAIVADGYTWSKWSNGTTTKDASLTMPATTLTCTPQVTVNSYKITYTLNDGTVSTANPTTYTVETATFTLNNPTKTGYTFAGWTGSNGTAAQASVSIVKGSTGDKTFAANWTINSYTVTFKDGNDTLKTETVNYGLSATAPVPTKPGYTLSWDKDFSNVTTDLTVNAIWTANTNTKYKVEYYQRTTDSEVVGYSLFETENLTGTTDTIATAEQKTYEGFTINLSYDKTILNENISGDGSLVLRLYYDRNIYTVNYELNGGTSSNNLTSTYTYGKKLVLSTKITKQGCTFLGWYDNSDFTGTSITEISESDIGNKTFYAKWSSQDEYYITSSKHTIDEQENYIAQISPNTDMQTFVNNISTNGNVKILNSKKEEITSSDLVGTGYIMQVEFNGTIHEYELVVSGDIDGNGKLTVIDLSKMNQAIVGRITLDGAYKKAADLDNNGKLTVIDLSKINQAIVGRITL